MNSAAKLGNFWAIILKYDVNTTSHYVIVTIKLNLLDVRNIAVAIWPEPVKVFKTLNDWRLRKVKQF